MNKRKPLFAVVSLFSLVLLTGCNNSQSSHTHRWTDVTYTWSDDNSSCYAERVCRDDETHKQSETALSTFKATKEATCSSEGSGQYVVNFKNEAFSTQMKFVTIDKLEHKWDEGEITRFPTIYEDGLMTYRCLECGEVKTEAITKTTDATNYTLDATKMEDLTGVYTAKATIGADKANTTLGIPLIAKQNLTQYPTYESPGIIQGAAVEYEKKTGAVSYEPLPGKELIAPYSYFRYTITEVQSKDADGNLLPPYLKLSGFDATYYIIRIDVSDLINGKTGYLHVKQTDNKALMVLVGMQKGVDTGVKATDDAGNATPRPIIKDGYWYFGDTSTNIKVEKDHNESLVFAGTNGNWFVGGTGFADGMGMNSTVLSLADNAKELKDTTGNHKETPYVDVIVLSSGKLAAGADAGKETAPTSDISLSMYIDDTLDYNPSLTYDPTSQDVNHAANVAKKFFDETKITENSNASSYLVKGSDLEIDVVTKETKDEKDVDEFWSLNKAMDYQDYNAHTIKLLCEVPVLEGLEVKSINEEYRQVILDVNSFDIQIANHSETDAAGLVVSNNASLEILDSSNTVGAELAIGNNAKMEVKDGGKLIIDTTCQLEIEYDAASKVHDTTEYTVEQIIEKINALPEPSAVKEANRADIEAAKDAYDVYIENGGDEANITNRQKLLDCIANLPAETALNNGEVTVRSGGELVNEGIINIEGLEVKPQANNEQESKQRVDRDMKAASLFVEEGGLITNHGCIGVKGDLYLLGTLNNYGRYNEIIKGTDPDKGTVDHHKGIQVSWKDDVTVLKEGSTTEYTINPDVKPGTIHVGIDANNVVHDSATLNNYGDIVLVPGKIEVYGTFMNHKNADDSLAALYLCEVSEAIVPITPTQANPTQLEERRQFSPSYPSVLDTTNAKSYVNNGTVMNAQIELVGNGLFGKLTVLNS